MPIDLVAKDKDTKKDAPADAVVKCHYKMHLTPQESITELANELANEIANASSQNNGEKAHNTDNPHNTDRKAAWTPMRIIHGFCLGASCLGVDVDGSIRKQTDLPRIAHRTLRKHTCEMCTTPIISKDPVVIAFNMARNTELFNTFVQECCVVGDGDVFSAMCEVQAAFAAFLRGHNYMSGVCAKHIASSSFVSKACKALLLELSPGWRMSDVDTRYIIGLKVVYFPLNLTSIKKH